VHQEREVDQTIERLIKRIEAATPVYALAAMSDDDVIYSFNGPSELLLGIVDKLKEHIVSQSN